MGRHSRGQHRKFRSHIPPMTYSQKLKDPRWQKKRLEILERDKWTCQICHQDDDTLHVHHVEYRKCEPWETPNELLTSLCEICHDRVESYKKRCARLLCDWQTSSAVEAAVDIAEMDPGASTLLYRLRSEPELFGLLRAICNQLDGSLALGYKRGMANQKRKEEVA